MIRSRWLLAVSVAGLGSAVLWAAGQAGDAGKPENSSQSESAMAGQTGAAASGGVTTFRTNANLVLVDVVVREKQKPVLGLKNSDFEVWEDGKPQKVTVFEEHQASDAEGSMGVPALAPHEHSNIPQYRMTSAANVLLLDALNTRQNDQTFARAQMLKYLHTIPAGTQIAVFTLASQLRMISGFTTDAATIEKALSLEKTPSQKRIVGNSSEDIADKQIDEAVTAEIPEITQELNDFQQGRQSYQEEQQMAITLGAFSELARYLSTVPGRKNLIWVSGGMSRALDPDLSRMKDSQMARFATAVQTVNAELMRARVAVYPVDARAVMNLQDSNLADTVAPVEMGEARDLAIAKGEAAKNDITTPQQWGESQQEMKQVAADTGGEAFFNTNAIGKAVEAALADGENYYTLGYAPPPAKNDGTFHTIKVEVAQRKYDLAYRRGYFATSPAEAGQEAAVPNPITEAMEPGVPPLSQIIFETQVLPAGDPELHGVQPAPGPAGKPGEPLRPPVTRYFVNYSIDPDQLVLKGLPDGKQQVNLEVVQAVYTPQGKRLNFTDVGLDVRLPGKSPTGAVRVRQQIDVPGEPVHLQLGVRDASSGKIGTLEIPLNGAQ